MNKIISTFIFCIIPVFLLAQSDGQTSILTEDGVFTVSQTVDGKDMICFNIHLWDDMVKGTKYSSKNLCTLRAKKACIEIANKNQLQCKAGAGFRCGIFDCLDPLQTIPALVNRSSRICSVIIQKQDSTTIKLIFLDIVDWQSLQIDH
ncbi:MAG: hypothetical protein ABI741_06500 [Ferruginibacter sp.]